MDFLILYFAGCSLVALAMFLVKSKWIDNLLYVPFVALQVMLNIHEAIHLNLSKGRNFVPYLDTDFFIAFENYFSITYSDGQYFKTDAIGLIFLTVLTIVSIVTVIHGIIYSNKMEDDIDTMEVYNGSLVMLICTMSGVMITSHVGLMWAFLEATTLCSSMLIYHNRDKFALEAAWKYIFVCSIAVSLAFVGILFLGMAAHYAHELDLSVDGLILVVKTMDPLWLKLSFILVIVGYSAKMGLIPMFTVDIDAKDVAPSPIGALFSGGLMNAGFLAIFRFYQVLAASSPEIHQWANNILLIIGIGSILVAAVYILRVKNLKRMLAYSSVEHAGIVLVGLAMGGIGYFAAIFHLIMHAFIKSSLFIQIGQVYRVFDIRGNQNFGGYMKINPIGSIVLILGLMCITAMPPSGLFLSEYFTFKALYAKENYVMIIGIVILLTVIFYGMFKNIINLLFGKAPVEIEFYEKMNPLESLTQFILLGAVIWMGIDPPKEVIEFINIAVSELPK